MKIQLYDTTLRDGVQGCGIEYTPDDALRVAELLDQLGMDYIEFCNFDEASPSEAGSLLEKIPALRAEVTIFGSTCHPDEKPSDNRRLCAAAASRFQTVTIVGKASLFQVTEILHTTAEENLRMIRDTIGFLTEREKKVLFDAEHFFDGYADNPAYAVEVLQTAWQTGAGMLILCDTNGGMLPDAVGLATGEVIRRFPGDVRFGIHCHNDIGMAEADSLEAVLSGAVMVQGSVSGMGERCGNANLNTLIPLLQLKLGYSCIASEQLERLTPTVRRINELANRAFDENEPFVGSHAFTHKAGMHIDGVNKNPRSFEHIDPALVGNERNYLASRLSGRAAALKFLHTAIPELTDLDKNSDKVIGALELLRQKENEGYNYEGASASLWLLLRNHFGLGRRSFELIHYQVNINESSSESLCTAIVKIRVGEISTLTAAEGNGPVNALDIALRRALTGFYPQAGAIRLTDYRVRVLASAKATASTVRVVIETTDGIRTWRTTGASFDIIDASWQALADSYEYAFQTSRKDTD